MAINEIITLERRMSQFLKLIWFIKFAGIQLLKPVHAIYCLFNSDNKHTLTVCLEKLWRCCLAGKKDWYKFRRGGWQTREILRRQRPNLRRDLDVMKLLPELFSVLDPEDEEEVQAEPTRRKRSKNVWKFYPRQDGRRLKSLWKDCRRSSHS